jgi:hypothetical protein
MPNLKHPFEIIICALLTLFVHHPVADAQLIPYNNIRLEPKFFWYFPNGTPCAHYGHSCRWENDRDWMGNKFPEEGSGYGTFYRMGPGNMFPAIDIWRSDTPPSFGAGVTDALYLYDALVRNGVFTPKPVHISIIDTGSPEHNRPVFHQIFGPVEVRSYNHAQFVSDVLLSPNTIWPEQPADFPHGMVGALPRELQRRRAVISSDPNGLYVSGTFRVWNSETRREIWSLPVIRVGFPASDPFPNAVLVESEPIVRLLAGKTVRMRETPNRAGSYDCTWDAKCLLGGTQNEFRLAGLSRPANVVNYSGGFEYSHKKIDALLLDGADLSKYHCGGFAFQELLDDLVETVVVEAGTNEPPTISSLGFGCKNVVSSIGYHRYTSTQTVQGDFEAIIAKSYPFTNPNRHGYLDCSPFSFWCWVDGQPPLSMQHPGNYAAMPYGRVFYTYDDLPYFQTGNSFTAPLIAGMLTLMRSIHPDFQGTSGASALQTLLLGSNKKAYVARIFHESIISGKHPANVSVPIVNPVCMLLQGVIDKEIASAERIASAVGGNTFFNKLVIEHGCAVAQL